MWIGLAPSLMRVYLVAPSNKKSISSGTVVALLLLVVVVVVVVAEPCYDPQISKYRGAKGVAHHTTGTDSVHS